jgi:hypothetical protein
VPAMYRIRGARAYYLVATLLFVSALIMPALGLQITASLQSSGTIIYPTGFFYGVCAHPWALTERDFQEMQTLGVKYVRMDFRWPDIEKTRDAPWDFTEKGYWSPKESYDTFVGLAKKYGIEIIVLLNKVPSWISPSGDTIIPPTGPDFDDFVTQFGQFVYAVVDHYKGDLTYFEIWNEPNTRTFWTDGEGTLYHGFIHGEATRKYVLLLQEAYIQAKAANPICVVITGGIANDHKYLQEMYSYGAKGYFDVFGSHPYFANSPTKNWDVDYINPHEHEWHFPKIQYMRDVMVANGDEAKRILITEVGVDGDYGGVEGPEGPTTQEIQADRLTRVFEKTQQEFPYVEGIMWYQLKDTHKAYSSVPVTIANWGLFRMNGPWDPDYPNVVDYTPRLMYYAYKQLISASST